MIESQSLMSRMKSCNPEARFCIEESFDNDVELSWKIGVKTIHTITLSIYQLDGENMVFQKAMHKAKEDMRGML